jgi:hypothetical protein
LVEFIASHFEESGTGRIVMEVNGPENEGFSAFRIAAFVVFYSSTRAPSKIDLESKPA